MMPPKLLVPVHLSGQRRAPAALSTYPVLTFTTKFQESSQRIQHFTAKLQNLPNRMHQNMDSKGFHENGN
jgi:hypothetical protein